MHEEQVIQAVSVQMPDLDLIGLEVSVFLETNHSGIDTAAVAIGRAVVGGIDAVWIGRCPGRSENPTDQAVRALVEAILASPAPARGHVEFFDADQRS